MKYLIIITLLLTSCTRDYHRLQMVQHEVNSNVTYRADIIDKWQLPLDGYGDCEDYAILKQKSLSDINIKSYLAICYTERLRAHAVLLADISDGLMVLDNRYGYIKRFNSLPYIWLSKETESGQWVSIATGINVNAPYGYIEYKNRNK